MTTAHRPTWTPAIGGEEQGGSRMFVASRQISAKNLPGHTKLKFRQDGQSSAKELKERDLLAELEEKERLSLLKKRKAENFSEEQVRDLKLLEGGPVKTARPLVPKNIDADDDDGDDDDDDDDSDDDEDEEDDEAALLAELERIKKERAEEAAVKAREEEAAAQAEQADEMLRRNPLLLQEADMTIKRQWDDDVIFKNQARGEPKKQARFVNDTIRNDFHKRFLHRYIK